MKTVDEYAKEYPSYENYLTYLSESLPQRAVLLSGMLKFNEETAYRWSGPFSGNYAFFKLVDYTNDPKLENVQEIQQKEIKYFEKMARQHPSRAKEYKKGELAWHKESVSKESPIKVYVCGNDDTSYSKFFASKEEALEFARLLISGEELDFDKDILSFGFIFTN